MSRVVQLCFQCVMCTSYFDLVMQLQGVCCSANYQPVTRFKPSLH
jgi:hypothetical protein